MNDFQVRKQQKQQSMATKVTEQKVSENIPDRQRTPAQSMEEKCILSLIQAVKLLKCTLTLPLNNFMKDWHCGS